MGVKTTDIREGGLVGTFFSKEKPTAAILVLGGYSGGLREEKAQLLAEAGFATLTLAYFGMEHLPSRLSQIPIEYFEKAIGFLNDVSGQIGLWGVSRGAELALILGTLFPDRIGAIAAHVPSSVIYGDLETRSSIPAWTYRNQLIAPSAPFQLRAQETGECESAAIRATPSFLHSMQDQTAFASSAICVEKLKSPLLLISAGDDQMWPSSLFARQIVERLEKHKSDISCSHIHYPGAGHAPSKGTVAFHPVLKRWFSYGGNPEDNDFAARDWTERTLSFFKEHL